MSPSLPARGLLGLIQIYKWTLSPLIGNACRYRPTCSSYAADSVRAHGAWAGSWMAGARLCRCQPWGGSGWDPAPTSIKKNSWWRPWRYGDWAWKERGNFPSPRGEGAGGGEKLRTLPQDDLNTRDDSEASRFTPPPAPSSQEEGERSAS